MKFSFLLSMLCASLTTFAGSFALGGLPIALIYNGPGTCTGCPETVAERLWELGYEIRYVGATVHGRKSAVTAAKLSEARIYVQPGGKDVLADTLKALTPEGQKAIREYVSNGGTYLGVCAGGFLAGSKFFDKGKYIDGLGLISCQVSDEYPKNSKSRVETVTWQHHGDPRKSESRDLYFQGGPKFCSGLSKQRIYATFKSGDVAAMTVAVGRGKVGLIGPHPEADADWFNEDKTPIEVPNRPSHDLFNEVVLDLNPPPPAAAAPAKYSAH